jgi:prepilin signal peptidase PulO-like enzyme (type II secretory pathway)
MNILAGPILALPFALLWLISKGNWIGLGDAKLILGLGWLLQYSKGINALVLAFWIAAFISIIWLYFKYKKFKAHVEIPFGPYIILGLYIALFFNVTIIDVHILYALIFS